MFVRGGIKTDIQTYPAFYTEEAIRNVSFYIDMMADWIKKIQAAF